MTIQDRLRVAQLYARIYICKALMWVSCSITDAARRLIGE